MKVGVLTSSRADYGIYLPLLKALKADPYFDLKMLVFGAHMSEKFGYTKSQIEADGFSIGQQLNTMFDNDTPGDIVRSMAKTQSEFSRVWDKETFDLIFALGDRYEMFAAVSSTVPFNIPVAHIHGGEATLGAIDNSFRHSITSMSAYHFTSCEEYKNRVIEIKGTDQGVYNVGALSIDVLATVKFLTIDEFHVKYHIDLSKPTILFTFHPETVNYNKNEVYIKTLTDILSELHRYQIVITMPNADTMGNIIRDYLKTFISNNSNAFGIESFGSIGYLSCMKYCSFMLGNTSSGFVEASWFPKHVINVGERQKGRILTPNIINCIINKNKILKIIQDIESNKGIFVSKIYGEGNTAQRIIALIKKAEANND